ncbi:mucin-associated surface protein (MASP), putative, partial [Trypanosoma cruzi]
MAMMTGRVLLVCALCVLWCGAVLVSAAGDGDGDGRGVDSEGLPESAERAVLLPSSPEPLIQLKAVSNPPPKRVEEAPTPAKESSEEGSEAGEDEVIVKSEEGQQDENAPQVNGRKTPELLLKQNETPKAPEVEGIPTAASIKESPTTPGPQAPTLQAPSPPPPPSQASVVGEGDGGPVRVEDPVSGPPSSGASSSTISNNGDASGKNGGALPTQDTTYLENNGQSGPKASSGNAPLNRETPERSTPDAKRHSSDAQENEMSRLPDGDA